MATIGWDVILILGGKDDFNHLLGDGYIYNAKNQTIDKVFSNEFPFETLQN